MHGRNTNRWVRKWDIPFMMLGWLLFGFSMQRWETGRDFFGKPCDDGGVCFNDIQSTGPNFGDRKTKLCYFSGLGVLASTSVLGLCLGGRLARNQTKIFISIVGRPVRLLWPIYLSSVQLALKFVVRDIGEWLLSRAWLLLRGHAKASAGFIFVVCISFLAKYFDYFGQEPAEVEGGSVDESAAHVPLATQFYLPFALAVNCIAAASKTTFVYVSAQSVFFLVVMLPSAICYLVLYSVVVSPQWMSAGIVGIFRLPFTAFSFVFDAVVPSFLKNVTLLHYDDFDAVISFLKNVTVSFLKNATSLHDDLATPTTD